MDHWKALGRLPISANWTFLPALTTEALWADIGQNCGFWKGVGHTERKCRGRGSSTNDFWRQKTRVPGLFFYVIRDVVCVILRLAVLIQYQRVTDRHTDRQTMMANKAHHYSRAGNDRHISAAVPAIMTGWRSSTLLTAHTCKNLKFRKSKMAAAPSWKIEKSSYLSSNLSDFDKIWHMDAALPSWPYRTDCRMAEAAISKNRHIWAVF